MRICLALISFLFVAFTDRNEEPQAWIRINQLGYTPKGIKIAVYGAVNTNKIRVFYLKEAGSGKIVFEGSAGNPFGAYGPFSETYRLDFSAFTKKGKYYLITEGAE